MDRLYDSRNVNFDLITEKALLQKTADLRQKELFLQTRYAYKVPKK